MYCQFRGRKFHCAHRLMQGRSHLDHVFAPYSYEILTSVIGCDMISIYWKNVLLIAFFYDEYRNNEFLNYQFLSKKKNLVLLVPFPGMDLVSICRLLKKMMTGCHFTNVLKHTSSKENWESLTPPITTANGNPNCAVITLLLTSMPSACSLSLSLHNFEVFISL